MVFQSFDLFSCCSLCYFKIIWWYELAQQIFCNHTLQCNWMGLAHHKFWQGYNIVNSSPGKGLLFIYKPMLLGIHYSCIISLQILGINWSSWGKWGTTVLLFAWPTLNFTFLSLKLVILLLNCFLLCWYSLESRMILKVHLEFHSRWEWRIIS